MGWYPYNRAGAVVEEAAQQEEASMPPQLTMRQEPTARESRTVSTAGKKGTGHQIVLIWKMNNKHNSR